MMSDLYLMELLTTELGLSEEEALLKAQALRETVQGSSSAAWLRRLWETKPWPGPSASRRPT